jgi:hypothetical protein
MTWLVDRRTPVDDPGRALGALRGWRRRGYLQCWAARDSPAGVRFSHVGQVRLGAAGNALCLWAVLHGARAREPRAELGRVGVVQVVE